MGNPEFDYDILVKPLESRMMRTIWRIIREQQAAEDALQDALVVIWRKRDTVARHPNPQALILRIAITAALDAARRRRRRLSREIPGLPEQGSGDAAPPIGNDLETAEVRTAVLAAIGRLPKRQAAAVLLRIVEDQSYEEIAQAMGCSESTARIHVMRGRATLAGRMAEWRPGTGLRSEESGKEESR